MSSPCPLALAFGITTGLGAEAGLVTAIVAGLVAAVFGGSNVQVSGPTGAMTVVLVPVVARFGADAVLVVGHHRGRSSSLAAAFLRLGRYLAFVPWPVVEGFTLGIAVIIFLQQVPLALGVPGRTVRALPWWPCRPSATPSTTVGARTVVLVLLVVAIMVGAAPPAPQPCPPR